MVKRMWDQLRSGGGVGVERDRKIHAVAGEVGSGRGTGAIHALRDTRKEEVNEKINRHNESGKNKTGLD
jgi:hypothetical protein